jgi:hypothetical protein
MRLLHGVIEKLSYKSDFEMPFEAFDQGIRSLTLEIPSALTLANDGSQLDLG